MTGNTGRAAIVGMLLSVVVWLPACLAPASTAVGGDPEVHKIAFLRAVPGTAGTVPAFLEELRTAGFNQGLNLSLLAGDSEEVYPERAAARAAVAGWRREGVDLIVALSTDGARVALEEAPDVHILFISNDPVTAGLVDEERRPGGGVTGVSFRVPADRTLDVARRLIPGLEVVGLPIPEGDEAASAHQESVAQAARELGLELLVEPFQGPEDAEAAVERLAAREIDALLLSNSPSASRALAQTGAAATRLGLPMVSNTPLATDAVVTLAPDSEELGRQLGRQAVRLLSGSSVVSVPVEDPRRFLLTINVVAAERLGIEIPDEMLREANSVITP